MHALLNSRPSSTGSTTNNITGGVLFDTVAAVQAATISGSINSIQTAGYYAAGDGGGAIYKRVGSNPSHNMKIQSADGAWWSYGQTSVSALAAGAKGDGSTNDRTAINNAIVYLNSVGGGELYFPRGVYMVDSGNITILSGVALRGVRRESIIKTAWVGSSSVQLIGAANATDIALVDLVFDGNQAILSNFLNVFQLFNVQGCTVTGCRFQNCKGIAALLSTSIQRVTFNECEFVDCGTFPTFGPGGGRQAIALASGSNSYDNAVTNCQFTNIGLDAISGGGSSRMTVANNRFYNVGAAAVYMSGCTYFTITGNTIRTAWGTTSPYPNGIDGINSDFLTITGNLCFDNGGAGIQLAGCDQVSIVGNVCINNNRDAASVHRGGIVLSSASSVGCSNVTVSGNMCTDTQVTKTQQYGLVIDPLNTNIRVGLDNMFAGNLDGDIGQTPYSTDMSSETPVTYVAPYVSPNGTTPGIEARGTASNIDVQVKPKGTGGLAVANGPIKVPDGAKILWQSGGTETTSVSQGTGSPEGVVTANVGSLYLRKDNGSVFAKATGTGNTGWREVLSSVFQTNSLSDPLAGFQVKSDSNTSNSPSIRVMGRRNDGNTSPAFAGRLILDRWSSGAATGADVGLGAIMFGGNHTDANELNIRYPAGIFARAKATFADVNTMPTDIVVHTGKVGIVANATSYPGAEVIRFKYEGQVQFQPIATVPTANVGNGDVFYNSSTHRLQARFNGVWETLLTSNQVAVYDTIAAATAATIHSTVNAVRTNGYYASGDGGGAIYKRVGSNPAHGMKFQSADGAYWEHAEQVINVRAAGAKGDGTTIDTTAFTNAFAKAGSSGSEVIVPPGTYMCSRVELNSNMRVIGIGKPIVKAWQTTAQCLLFSIVSKSNVYVSGIIFDGQDSTIAATSMTVIVYQGTDCVFENCTFQNSRSIGLYYSSLCVRPVVRNCTFYNIGAYNRTSLVNTGGAGGVGDRQQGLAISSSTSPQIIGCEFRLIGLDPISVTGSSDVKIIGNKITDCDASGIYFHDNTSGVIAENWVSNYAPTLALGGLGMDIYATTNLVVSNNVVTGCGAGGILLAGGCKRVTVANNVVTNNKQYAAEGNFIGGICFHLVSATSTEDITISGNVVVDTQGASVTQLYAIGCLASGGTFSNVVIHRDNRLQGYSAGGAMNADRVFQGQTLGAQPYPMTFSIAAGASINFCKRTIRGRATCIDLTNSVVGDFYIRYQQSPIEINATSWEVTDTGTASALYDDGTTNIVLKNKTAGTVSYMVTLDWQHPIA